MTAFNIVRIRVKPGQEQAFEDEHRQVQREFAGLRRFSLVKTGERNYCFVGEWDAMASLVAARPQMIEMLDRMRHMLEELSSELGVTDPVSGEVVVEYRH